MRHWVHEGPARLNTTAGRTMDGEKNQLLFDLGIITGTIPAVDAITGWHPLDRIGSFVVRLNSSIEGVGFWTPVLLPALLAPQGKGPLRVDARDRDVVGE